MADKKKYYKLDDIGIVGKQEKKSSRSITYHTKKTGEVFRHHRENASKAITARPHREKQS